MTNDSQGHKWMRIWQNAERLDYMVQGVLKKIPRLRYKLAQQIDNASNSVLANFVEGYYSGSTAEYLRFVRYSKRSSGELQEHFTACLRRRYISQEEFNMLDKLSWQTMYLIDRLIRSLKKKLNLQV